MARTRWLLGRAEQDWRLLPMPGANAPLRTVRLDSVARFSILAEFPAGFERAETGGYAVAETFYLLAGRLEIGRRVLESGQLVHVPAHTVREGMRTVVGCRVLAWFEGLPGFVTADRLECVSDVIEVVDLSTLREPQPLLAGAGHRWDLVSPVARPADAEAFDPDTGGWSRTSADWAAEPPGRLIVRQSA